MADYISRDEFAEYLADIQYGEAPTGRTGENIDYQNGVYAGLDMAYVALKQFQAADVRPVVRGKWKHDGSDWKNRFICDQCGYKWFFEAEEARFCPNCGADMREEVPTDD